MSRKTEILISEDGITRRAFLVRSAGASVLVLAAASVGGAALAACAKPAATANFTAGSTVPDPTNHSHDVTILGADVDKPPSQKAYTTTTVFAHTHTVTLTKSNFEAIKKGETVTVVSSANGTTPHGHTYEIKRPA